MRAGGSAPGPRVFMAPGHYIQGPGSIDLVGQRAAALGRRLAVIRDDAVAVLIEERVRESCARAGIELALLNFGGAVTHAEIERLCDEARRSGTDIVAGAGGGRAIDAAKGVARRLGAPVVSIPTIASTDAPAARGIAIYDDANRPVAVEQLDHNPEIVIVDTAIIAGAPPRYLRAGIGDAVAKAVEAEACLAAGALTKHGTRPLRAGGMIAKACYRLVRAHGAPALAAAGRGEVTDDLEHVVEAVVLLSCMAFENGGLSLAHAVAAALSGLRGAREALHGEHVGYGTLVQLTVEGRPEHELADLSSFLGQVGLPISLAEFGLADPTEDEMQTLIETCLANPFARHLAVPADAAALRAAIGEVERRATERGHHG